MEWKLFADLREAAGDRRVAVDPDGSTVGDALDALVAARPALRERVFDDAGDVRGHLTLLRNGADVSTQAGLDTEVEESDELALFPPVSGG